MGLYLVNRAPQSSDMLPLKKNFMGTGVVRLRPCLRLCLYGRRTLVHALNTVSLL